MKKDEFVRKQLGTLPLVDWTNPKQAKIICPFHNDTHPSLDVSLVRQVKSGGRGVAIGGFNCWSCKAHGPWNKLARKLGLLEWTEATERDAEDIPDNDFSELERELEGFEASPLYEKPATDGPWEGPWRGLSGKFLRSIGAEMKWDEEFGEYRVFLPVHDAFGKPVGHVLARGENSNIPNKKKYLNSKGFNGRAYWYGLNFEEHPKVVVIVEGPFDMLRFRSEGIPAIANLGVQMRNQENLDETVSEEKVMQILSKGCSKVVLALDADDAGREGTKGMTASFQKAGLQVFDLNLSRYLTSPDESLDPGNAPKAVLDDLKSFIASLQG